MQDIKSLAPFSCKYTPNVPELLLKLKCTLAISTYQAGKVVFLSPQDENSLIQLPRTFDRPMGIALDENSERMAIACKDEIISLANSTDLAKHYPKKKNIYDALYLPRVSYHVGSVDTHDLSFGKDGLYAVNTLFSSVMKLSDKHNYIPYWTPPFITEQVSEDRCHLNGMVMLDGKPKYVTAFNQGNTYQSWRDVVTTDGILMDIDSNEIIVDQLKMPHSPRLFNNELYMLFSATGELVKVDIKKGKYEVISKIDGFVRGMAFHKDHLFIGLSKLRKNSSTFAKLDIANKANTAGIAIVHLPTASLVGQITYMASVDEIYDVQVLADKLRPNIMNTKTPEFKLGLSTPDNTYWALLKDDENN